MTGSWRGNPKIFGCALRATHGRTPLSKFLNLPLHTWGRCWRYEGDVPPDPPTLASITGCCVTSTIVVRHVLSCRFQVLTMNIIFRLLYLSMCLLATCEATSLVKHRAVTEDAEYLFGCKVTKKFGVTIILPGNISQACKS